MDDDHDYDHEAFLGEDAHEFDDLDPEESKRRLGVIVVSHWLNVIDSLSIAQCSKVCVELNLNFKIDL